LANGRSDPLILIQTVLLHSRNRPQAISLGLLMQSPPACGSILYLAHAGGLPAVSVRGACRLRLSAYVQLAAPFYGDGGISGFGGVPPLIRQQYPLRSRGSGHHHFSQII
jgi:hypothetical protein